MAQQGKYMAMYGRIAMISMALICMMIQDVDGDLSKLLESSINDSEKVKLSTNSLRIRRGFVNCFCSPDRKGMSQKTIFHVSQSLKELNEAITAMRNMTENEKFTAIKQNATMLLMQCFKEGGFRSCINADQHYRTAVSSQVPFCQYDDLTKKNTVGNRNGQLETVGPCPYRVNDLKEQVLASNSSSVREGLTFCSCSKSSVQADQKTVEYLKEKLLVINANISKAGESGRDEAIEVMRKKWRGLLDACAAMYSYDGCVNGDAALRRESKIEMTICTYESVYGRNVANNYMGTPNTVATLGECRSTANMQTQQMSTEMTSQVMAKGSTQYAKASSANEGCVAVEHLRGYVLQHRRHLYRRVLCHHGFCATPNHAILLDNSITSMGELCAETWKCHETMKMVNNLKVAVNRRARVSARIVVTPYDIRFGKIATWAVQIIEDVVELVMTCVALSSLLTVSLVVSQM